MASEAGSPKREPTPGTSAPSIPQKRAFDEGGHSPAVSSPLNPEVRFADAPPSDDAVQVRSKPVRAKKESLKKRESKGVTDSARATPDPKVVKEKEPEIEMAHAHASPFRYKLGAPKPFDFQPARGPATTHHHSINVEGQEPVQFFEGSDQ